MVSQVVLGAFLVGAPALLAFLGIVGFARDRCASVVLLIVAGGFVAMAARAGLAWQIAEAGPRPSPGLLWLLAGAGLALGLRLHRDRRQGHVRSTAESLAVLACGAILLAMLLSLPTIFAELARLRAV